MPRCRRSLCRGWSSAAGRGQRARPRRRLETSRGTDTIGCLRHLSCGGGDLYTRSPLWGTTVRSAAASSRHSTRYNRGDHCQRTVSHRLQRVSAHSPLTSCFERVAPEVRADSLPALGVPVLRQNLAIQSNRLRGGRGPLALLYLGFVKFEVGS